MRLGKQFQMADEHLEPKEEFFFWHISIHKSKVLRLDQADENMDFEWFVALKFEES